jgi:cytochrome c
VEEEEAMLKQLILVIALTAMAIANPANAQQSPPTSQQAKRIEALANKAAALVVTKGKAALFEFRERGSDWWSGDVDVFAHAPEGTVILIPAFPEREGHANHGEQDKKGKAFHDELLKTAQTTERHVRIFYKQQGLAMEHAHQTSAPERERNTPSTAPDVAG